ncbi:MAG: GNAT family N-acetyltransferase [Pseudomonadota bacterium]
MVAIAKTVAERKDVRPATVEDAALMAELIEIAGAGIPTYLWSTMAEPGETPLEVGARRAGRETGSFSYTNAMMATVDGKPVGMLLAYPLGTPSAQDVAELDQTPPLFRPLVELEHQAPGSFYINALAVLPGWRDRGLGGVLLDAGIEQARAKGCTYLSVQAFSQNPDAIRLYQRHGYEIVDRRPIVAHPCYPYDEDAVLMTREIER